MAQRKLSALGTLRIQVGLNASHSRQQSLLGLRQAGQYRFPFSIGRRIEQRG
jgi:hypothetical protein